MKFITGLSGEAHVKPAMDAQWHSAINGAETFVYDYGQKFALTVNQAMSTMSIASGVGQIQGRLFIIEESLIETISYPNVPPEVGLTRIDTVLLHWGTSTRIINGETVTVNTCEFEYKKNPLANGQPEAFAETDLNLGDTDAYYPMWHVTWSENGIQEVDAIFTVVNKGMVPLDTTAPSGTTDGDLYSALVALGWENDVVDYMLNVKKTLTRMLSLTPTFEYVGNMNQIHWSSWTATDDGVIIMEIGWTTGGGGGYYYVKDITANREIAKMTTYSANGTSETRCFPVIKGHTYQVVNYDRVDGNHLNFFFYKTKLTENV